MSEPHPEATDPNSPHYVAALDKSGTCKSCKARNCITRHPGRFPYCWKCGCIQLWMPKTPDANCVTPNGRTDGHGTLVDYSNPKKPRCAFCRKILK